MALTKIGTTGISNNLDVPGYIYLSGDEKELRFYNGSNYIILKASASLGQNYTFTLPVDDGTTGQFLKSDGGGVLSWDSAGGVALGGNTTNNNIVTVTDSDTLNGEATLTYDGANLALINTTNSATALIKAEAQGNTSSARVVLRVASTNTSDAYISFHQSGGTEWQLGMDNSDSNKFKLGEGGTVDSNTRLTIQTDGKVGIGTASPDAELTVNGAIRAQNTVGAWVHTTWSGGALTISSGSHVNVASGTDHGTGDCTINWDVDFVTANTYVCGGISQEGRVTCQVSDTAQAVGSCRFATFVTDSGTRTDSNPINIWAIGKNFS